MSTFDENPGPSWLAALRPFADQSPGQHLLVALLGILAWSGTFLAVLGLLGGGGVATADTAAALEARRLAGLVASVVAGAYLGVAVARGRGGPVLNVLYAPVAAAVGTTGVPLSVAYGSAPPTMFAAPWGLADAWSGAGEVAVLSTAGAVALAVVGLYLGAVADADARARIERRYAALAVTTATPPVAGAPEEPDDD